MKTTGKKSIVIASARLDLTATVSIYLENRGWSVELVGSYEEALISINRSDGKAFALFDGTIGAESIESNLVDAVAVCGFDGFAVMTGDEARFKWFHALGIKVLLKPFLMSQLTEFALDNGDLEPFHGDRHDVNNFNNITGKGLA